MCSSEFTYKWHFTVNDLTKLKSLFFIFLLLLNGRCLFPVPLACAFLFVSLIVCALLSFWIVVRLWSLGERVGFGVFPCVLALSESERFLVLYSRRCLRLCWQDNTATVLNWPEGFCRLQKNLKDLKVFKEGEVKFLYQRGWMVQVNLSVVEFFWQDHNNWPDQNLCAG